MEPAAARKALDRVSEALGANQTKSRLLEEVAWGRDVEERFFARKASELPRVDYSVDREALEGDDARLLVVQRSIAGEGAIPTFLRNVLQSSIDRNRLLLATGTTEFGRLSVEIYGGASTAFFGLPLTNHDLAKHLLERLSDHGWDEASATEDPTLDAQGLFTKDTCYLAGLVHVHAFLAAFVRAGFRDECEMIVCGRFALDDIGALVELRAMGLLARPKYRPRWLREWSTLLPYFAVSSFLGGIDLAPVTARYAGVIALANAARPPQS